MNLFNYIEGLLLSTIVRLEICRVCFVCDPEEEINQIGEQKRTNTQTHEASRTFTTP